MWLLGAFPEAMKIRWPSIYTGSLFCAPARERRMPFTPAISGLLGRSIRNTTVKEARSVEAFPPGKDEIQLLAAVGEEIQGFQADEREPDGWRSDLDVHPVQNLLRMTQPVMKNTVVQLVDQLGEQGFDANHSSRDGAEEIVALNRYAQIVLGLVGQG